MGSKRMRRDGRYTVERPTTDELIQVQMERLFVIKAPRSVLPAIAVM
jgi:hypothetical protein